MQNLPMHKESKPAVTQRPALSVCLAYAGVWRLTGALEEPLNFRASSTVVQQDPWLAPRSICIFIYKN